MARYDRLRQTVGSKPANPTPGSDSDNNPKPANVTLGSCGLPLPDRSLGPPSRCQPFEAVIKAKLDQGLSAQRIYQDIVTEEGFEADKGNKPDFTTSLNIQ